MDSMQYKDFNRVPPRPPPRPKTYEYCPKTPVPPPQLGKFCRSKLKKHPSSHTMKYKMLRVCPRLDYREILCQPIQICEDDPCKKKPRVRRKLNIDDDESWVQPIPKPPMCPEEVANPCADDIDIFNLPPCKPKIQEYECGNMED